MQVNEGRARAVIERVTPEVDSGRFPIKRIVGDKVVVEADVFADGHDALSLVLLFRDENNPSWREASMQYLENDRWRGEFTVTEQGRYRYSVEAWIDPYKTWRRDLQKKIAAAQDVTLDLVTGKRLIRAASERASGEDARRLLACAESLQVEKDSEGRLQLAQQQDLDLMMSRYSDRHFSSVYDRELAVVVDREKARFSAWYEMFPRSSWSDAPTHGAFHGTFRDCESRLPYVAGLGFDVLYLPPIHPIGRSHRKGKNNSTAATADDPGSPWAIGSSEGGHKSIHPQLGSLDDFRGLLGKCRDYGIELALDLAFQCSPDHPYVKDHPEFFRWRPDGTVQYAENPPKKYEDIYPFDFETEHWKRLWDELLSIVDYWIAQGVRLFRVDNPHTKPFAFWEWLIASVKARHPDVLFLSEAFTRPKVMYRLAKLGFSQSYTYFAWRNSSRELSGYFTELARSEVSEYFRPNLWPNTPDILTEYLQSGARGAFMTRLVLAATLSANYGIYGPAYELCEDRAKEAGSEEYLNSEKYEIRRWDTNREDSLKDFIGRVNTARRENAALRRDGSLTFHEVDNEQLLCYSKSADDFTNVIVIVVNLDPHHTQRGWTNLRLDALGLDAAHPFQVDDLLTGTRYLWRGPRNFVELNPGVMPAHVFRVRRKIRTEREFDYYS
jgi:starch synthase (maltosyl-transferring)